MDKTVIVSPTNPLVKKIRKLSHKKYRTTFGAYIAEGKRWVVDARKLCPQYVQAVICSQSCDCAFADYVLSDALFSQLSSTESNQGVMAIMRIPESEKTLTSRYCLFLDRIRDPGNMGAIVRTACAAGYTDIVLHDCVDIYSPKVIRSCMTGILNVRLHYATDLETIVESGYVTVAAALNGQNIFSEELPHFDKVCLVIGNEGDGIDATFMNTCQMKVTIPMTNAMESLNAAVSAGILMYQLKRNNENKEN